jgi:hypothetical protein
VFRFQAAPREYYLTTVKRILRYFKFTPNIGLWYSKGAHFDLVGYSDSDYAGCKVHRKSTSDGYQFLEGHLFLGLQRYKIQLLSQPPKWNIFQPEVVVLNYYG